MSSPSHLGLLQQCVNTWKFGSCENFAVRYLVLPLHSDQPTEAASLTVGIIALNGAPLEVVQSFNYLGSTVTSSLSLDEEINIRIGKVATTFSRLTVRAWKNPRLTKKTKIL